MFNNYRHEISRKVEELDAIYNKIDKFFHQNFSIRGTEFGIVSDRYYYETKSYAVNIVMEWSKDFEDTISEIKLLQARHKGSIFDGDAAYTQDKYNKKRADQISEKYEKIMNLVRNSHIID